MAKNLELKLKIDNPQNLIDRAKLIGATFIQVLNQKDVYYKFQGSLLKLRIQDGKNELIKYNRNENGDERWSEYFVLKICDENPQDFFNKLFGTEIIVEKKRSLFLYKNTRIHIDDVKELGHFIELETVFTGDSKSSINEFNEVVSKLRLNLSLQIRKSYRDLLLNDSK